MKFVVEKVVEIEIVGHVGVFVGVAIEGFLTRRYSMESHTPHGTIPL